MENSSRIESSFRNFFFGSFSQIASLLLGFAVRSVFIRYLDITYLGLNGLFTNILTILSLAELGFGSVMVYALYSPLAKGDRDKVISYMQFYAKVYVYIGLIIAVTGVVLIPFLKYLIKDGADRFDNLNLLYLLFLSESVFSYFVAYKRSILNADQKSYIISWWHFVFFVIRSVCQILSLMLYANFILYIVIQILSTISENIYLSYKVDKIYPFLNTKFTIPLTKEELMSIKMNVYALVLSNFSRVALKGTSNIIISACVGIGIVGLYSNYLMITGALIMLLSQVFSALSGSVGNFIAKESSDKYIELFNRLDFLNFYLYGIVGICIYVFINPFISFWIGSEYLLNKNVVMVISANFMIEGFLYSLWLFRSTMGLFTQGKYRPVFSAVINIVFSVILGNYMGLIGVLLGTTLARILVNAWFDPYVIFKYGLFSPVKYYYVKYLKRLVVILCTVFICEYINNNWLVSNLFLIFFIKFVFLFILMNIVFYLIYRRTNEVLYYKKILIGYTMSIYKCKK